jgi:hypothetical protein
MTMIQQGRSWRLRPIIAWCCCHQIVVTVVGGVDGGMQRALLVREEEEFPSLHADTATDNDYNDWRG